LNEQRLAIVRGAFEQFLAGINSRAGGGLREAPWHPDVEYAEDERWPGASEFRGAEAVEARFIEYGEIIGKVQATLEAVTDAGDRAMVTATFRGSAGASGLPMDHTWTYLVTERDGMVVRFEAYLDPADARP
jgi:ketosteroid isomerase-like protein